MAGADPDADYTNFEYEHHEVSAHPDGPTGTGEAFINYSADPLADRGGLESDEVAEVVAILATVDAIDDTGVSGTTPARVNWGATFGIDLAEEEVPVASARDPGELGTNDAGFDADSGASSFALRSVINPAVLYSLTGDVISPQVEGTGAGSGGTDDQYTVERLYRQMVGRGPILDPTDSLDWWVHVAIENVAQDLHLHLSQTTVYDVATVDESRRKFSLP